ncbi:hypothetical protein BDR05DRAFT_956570 [Suillus weaverae]|nr:hypothetical protein BDR05DRAFT_956570 [Suillus weaverae]
MPVTTQDWLIFEQYAAWVRVLGHSDIFGSIDAKFIYAIMEFSVKAVGAKPPSAPVDHVFVVSIHARLISWALSSSGIHHNLTTYHTSSSY